MAEAAGVEQWVGHCLRVAVDPRSLLQQPVDGGQLATACRFGQRRDARLSRGWRIQRHPGSVQVGADGQVTAGGGDMHEVAVTGLAIDRQRGHLGLLSEQGLESLRIVLFDSDPGIPHRFGGVCHVCMASRSVFHRPWAGGGVSGSWRSPRRWAFASSGLCLDDPAAATAGVARAGQRWAGGVIEL
nr:hypothetical protein [Pseudomonas putida]